MHFIRTILATLAATTGCQSMPKPAPGTTPPPDYIEVGTVAAASASDTKRAFARAHIPAYTDGHEYPTYHILVPPEYRDQATALLRDLRNRPLPYLVTPN
jgi:hypothetical protein